ncbi:glycosyltransferase family 2 protein [Streptomyces sp. NPDC059568]|uniref:glycosyltransferase family 2 protein n=1 Tax=Streptomyces sp. NPDC059568 TaxID=3346868 RepID=UPI00368E6834
MRTESRAEEVPGTVPRGLSVIIPVRERVELLRRQLHTLRAAVAHCAEPAEIIVVDDSGPEDAARHRASCAEYGARYLRGPRHVGAKRNLGARHAAYDLLVFADSDQRSPVDLLDRYAAGLRRAPAEVAAVTGPLSAEQGDSATFRVMRRSYLLLGDHEDALRYHRMSWCIGGNTAIRRSVFAEVGGFPEDSPSPLGGEDMHLGLKLTDAGYVILCDPEARVIHDAAVAQTLRAVCYRFVTYGRSEQWLCAAHPDRRRFRLNAVSALAVTTAVGLAGASRSRGRSMVAVPLVAASLVAGRTLRTAGRERSARALADSLSCVLLELVFDGSAFVSALRMGRPDLLFAGFQPPTDEAHRRAPEDALPLWGPPKPGGS